MKSFCEYLQEAELMEDTPSTGDVFEIEIAREELVLETTVVDVLEDGIVIEADETMMSILRHVGYLAEDSNMPPAQDSISPVNGRKDVYKDFKFQHSEDNDLEEQQGISQRAQDAFKDLDANVTGSQPAQASDLDKFRQRAQQGSGKPIKLKDMPELDKKNWEREKQQQGIQNEAKYQGREVPLGKPMKGDVAKSKVYVRDPKTGNVKKVNFGDPNMKIKKSNPARRKSFRARHNCDNPGPRTKARYWSCRAW
jgi:hypothetical protein